jgi:hypothetical protein
MTTRESALAKTPVTRRRGHVHDDDSYASRELLTVHDVAALLQVPVSWVYEHARRSAPEVEVIRFRGQLGYAISCRPFFVLRCSFFFEGKEIGCGRC